MKKVAFLTSSTLKDLIPDERPLLQEFQARRFKAYPVIWDQEENWDQYDFVLVRNPWDYFQRVNSLFACSMLFINQKLL
jgi:hypothetical protein